jgi:multidrug efflux pump subunit AcrB
MMWFVRLALIRPYTFIVFAIFILLMGLVTIFGMSTDIFPEIDIPVVSVVWTYTGISSDEMAKRIVTISERAMTTTVNDIDHIESQSMNGVSVIKVFFHPGAKVEAGVAQITSVSQTILRVLPPGITPPFVIRYNASSVPILQLGLSSKILSEQTLFDIGLNFIRTQLATVQGASVPLPLGGKARQIMVDIDPQLLYANRLSANDIVSAINAQNIILPAGTAKIGNREYVIKTNSSPEILETLNSLPIKTVNGATITIHDVAQVKDGYAVQSNVVRDNGRRGALLTVLKASGASTLDIVARIKKSLPGIQATLPPALDIKQLFDQSIFVKASIDGVLREAVTASCLTALMILIFLGSWRSTIIVVTSIPLSIFCSIICLNLCGQNLNVMTLGGLALAIGMLVDDATVEVENIHRNQHLMPKETIQHIILVSAQEVATPALVATLSICIVFCPVVLVSGAAKYLFVPLAMAVVFAMLASYVLSRTLVPVLAMYLMPHTPQKDEAEEASSASTTVTTIDVTSLPGHPHSTATQSITSSREVKKPSIFARFSQAFETQFEKLRQLYSHDLGWGLNNKPILFAAFTLFFVGSFFLTPWVGRDFFPSVDAGQIRLHLRAPTGSRIESTEHYFSLVDDAIRRIIPANEIESILDNIGLPNSGINLAFGDNATVGRSDGEILVALKENHGPTPVYVRKIRRALQEQYPELTFFFQPADIVSQILNFGLPAPIDIQITGRNFPANYKLAKAIREKVQAVPGATDVHLHQILDEPEYDVNIDRVRASQLGLSQRDVATSMLVSLSSSGQVTPNYWLNPQNGVNYLVAVQTPPYQMDSLSALEQTPVYPANAQMPQLLSNLAELKPAITQQVVSHYNVQPVLDIFAGVQDRDLGGVSDNIAGVLKHFSEHLPRGTTLTMRGQVQSMNSSFTSLGFGLLLAITLVYLLMVVNFQSWIDPLIIMMGTPATLTGVLWGLFATGTTFSVPSLMGTIMSIGVATANSILIVSFANEQREQGKSAVEAVRLAGETRFRPVIMTALAMIIGMLPMALGLGEGGEQNAPLGRAVVGGLLVATFSTLFFIPLVYSVWRKTYHVAEPVEDLPPDAPHPIG